MLENLPQETTQLLIDLCTSTGLLTPEVREDTAPSGTVSRPQSTGPSYLALLALNRNPTVLPPVVVTAPSDTATIPTPSVRTVRPSDNASRRDSVLDPPPSRPSTPPLPATPPVSQVPPGPLPVKRLSPRIYFAHFVDHMDEFIVFLETVAIKRWRQSVDEENNPSEWLVPEPPVDEEEDKQDQVAVWNTLLELYLTLPGTLAKSSLVESTLRAKALRVLESSEIPYDRMHALILCSTHNYTPGLVLLWEKMGMYEDVVRFWMDKDKDKEGGGDSEASGKVIECLDKYGRDHPHLYPLVLRFLTSRAEVLGRHWVDVKRIIEECVDGVDGDGKGMMSPLGVVQVLGRNEVASVGLVREWLIERVKKARAEIQSVSARRLYA